MITWRFSVVLLFMLGVLLTPLYVEGNLGSVLTQSKGNKHVVLKIQRACHELMFSHLTFIIFFIDGTRSVYITNKTSLSSIVILLRKHLISFFFSLTSSVKKTVSVN